jgi:hypothetical protein
LKGGKWGQLEKKTENMKKIGFYSKKFLTNQMGGCNLNIVILLCFYGFAQEERSGGEVFPAIFYH